MDRGDDHALSFVTGAVRLFVVLASRLILRERQASGRRHLHRPSDNRASDRPASRNAPALFEPHDPDAVALVAAEDVIGGCVLGDVEADVGAARAGVSHSNLVAGVAHAATDPWQVAPLIKRIENVRG